MFISVYQWLNSAIWHIKQDGTGNFIDIQSGIDASADSDTVLVYPGTYLENIDFTGKNITVASLFLTTGNEDYIDQTIIDGNQNGSVVSIKSDENENAVLCGFTIINGSGTLYYSTGPLYGGGIFCEDSSPIISYCNIKENYAQAGGGICLKDAIPSLEKVTIKGNHAYSSGGGIYLTHGASINFSDEELCNIYLNFAAFGCEIKKRWDCDSLDVIVDTFTVLEPDKYFIASTTSTGIPLNDITLYAQHAKLDPVNADLYVSPQGSNDNSGLSPDEPLQTINYAYSLIATDSLHPNAIHLADGIYSNSENGQLFPLNARSYISLLGESMESTIFDGEGQYSFISGIDGDHNITIENITFINGYEIDRAFKILILFNNPNSLINRFITFNNVASNNNIFGYGFISISHHFVNLNNCSFIENQGGKELSIGLGLNCETVEIENVIIDNCTQYEHPDVFYAYPIFIIGSHYDDPHQVVMKNVQITNNVDNNTEWWESCCGIQITDKIDLYLINCTIGNNTTPGPSGGAIMAAFMGTEFNIINSIFYGDLPRELFVGNTDPDNPLNVNIINSLIQGGEAGIYIYPGEEVNINWDESSIDTDPLWLMGGDYPYMLSDDSPCIDTGTLELPPGIELPEYDLAGNPRIFGETVDMGAYEWQGSPVINDELKIRDYELKNYPNPFNPSTRIYFYLHEDTSDIELNVYNAKGQKVRTLLDDKFMEKGNHSVYWNGKNNSNQQVSSGVYFYQLKTDVIMLKSKALLLK